MINKTRMNDQHANSKYTNQTYQSCFAFSSSLRQITLNIGNCAVRNICIQFSSYTHKPKRCYSYCQQQTTGSFRISHSCFMPLPTTSFCYPETLLYPSSHSIPTDARSRRCKVCYDDASFCPSPQSASNVQERRLPLVLKATPEPCQLVPGCSAKLRIGLKLPQPSGLPSGQNVPFPLIRMNGCHLSLAIRLKSLGE